MLSFLVSVIGLFYIYELKGVWLFLSKDFMNNIETTIVSKDSGKGQEQDLQKQTSIPSDPYARVTRMLSEEEMNSPAVLKLLLSENDRQGREIDVLKEFEQKFYKRDKEAAVLEEKLNQSIRGDILYTVCETVGSALMAASGIFWENKGWIILVVGALLVVGGLVFKFVKR